MTRKHAPKSGPRSRPSRNQSERKRTQWIEIPPDEVPRLPDGPCDFTCEVRLLPPWDGYMPDGDAHAALLDAIQTHSEPNGVEAHFAFFAKGAYMMTFTVPSQTEAFVFTSLVNGQLSHYLGGCLGLGAGPYAESTLTRTELVPGVGVLKEEYVDALERRKAA